MDFLNVTSVVVGIVFFCLGVWALNYASRSTHKSFKWSGIAIAMVGAFLVWSTAARMTPVLSHAEIHILKLDKGWALASVEVENLRKCKLESIKGFLLDGQGVASETEVTLIESTTPFANNKVGYLIIRNTTGFPARSVYFVSQHSCPFGFEVKTEFGKTDLPPEFNTGIV